MVTCGPAQVAVEYSVSARGFFIASWGSTLVVQIVVGSCTVGTPRGLVAGHVCISWVAKLETVFAHQVFVIGVHAFGFAGSVVDAPGHLFS